MDPNANLQEQERVLKVLDKLSRASSSPWLRLSKPKGETELRSLRYALIRWIRDSGCNPDWSKAPNARKYFGK